MKISVLQIGSVPSKELKALCQDYEDRLKRYTKLEVITLPDIKNASSLSQAELKKKEWEVFSAKLPKSAILVLLDEKGKQHSSTQFASFINAQQTASVRELVFIIGGAFGFDEKAYDLAQHKLSLSAMTFSHQMIRLIFLEQLYRAFTIIKGEKYHHE
ncbi:MAG TPA: 23S rRNA (pseudouridine(1915)-N(3))-methyltransferase RlmH [Flavobacteriales bacterium]|nr:23S rRNA (pseudouridine(1915)-N(3))-methyltransferase RlmH [Flavobacteriales bacterium]